jgi:prepilin-type N-terminal cleavage/methylation domain-containing protein
MNHVIKRQQGFTIIELLLAMSFVSLLLMAITMTVIQVASIYTKGLTLRSVGQVGQTVAQDIRRSIESARPLDVGTDENGGLHFKPMVAVGGDLKNPDGGRLCTGSYSYIWNNGKALTQPVNKYVGSDETIRLVKVADNGSIYCSDLSRGIAQDQATEMLSGGDRVLAVQSFKIKRVGSNPDAGQALYFITLEVGTNDQDSISREVSLNTVDTSCQPPADGVRLEDYCAINKFEFTARAGNTGGSR